MADLALEILEWAKTKEDLAEIFYENGSLTPPVRVSLVFDREGLAPSNGKRFFYLKAPTIGKVSFQEDKIKAGQTLLGNDLVGIVEGAQEKLEVRSPSKGTIQEVLVSSGKTVGFGEPLLLIETK